MSALWHGLAVSEIAGDYQAKESARFEAGALRFGGCWVFVMFISDFCLAVLWLEQRLARSRRSSGVFVLST